MPVDFRQVREQVNRLGGNARQRQQELEKRRQDAQRLLEEHARNLDFLQNKVQQARQFDPSLRCALPVSEALDTHQPASRGEFIPPPTLLAVDGSQIFNDRHAETQYGLINIGAVQMQHGGSQPPAPLVQSTLLYNESLERMSDAALSLKRDLNERMKLAELAAQAPAPVIAFTDGPLELWGSIAEGPEAASQYRESLKAYLDVLRNLHQIKAITAGYVDRPGANLVVRLLETCRADDKQIESIRSFRPFSGVSDADLYEERLGPGERSAVFALQSQGAGSYSGALALHFFYLNVGTGMGQHASLARVEIPAWVAEDAAWLEMLHAVLLSQCRIMGARHYPYLLHRAHETALVTHREQEEVTEMIVGELLRQGIPVRGRSHKQAAKDLPGRTRHKP